jgi:hypothetical protein
LNFLDWSTKKFPNNCTKICLLGEE